MPDETQKDIEVAKLEPPVTGSAGDQSAAASKGGSNAVTIFDGTNLGAALTDYSDMKSAAVSTIAVAAFYDYREQARKLATQLEVTRAELSDAKEHFRDEREKRLKLEAREAERGRTSWIEKTTLTVGGVIAGVGLSLVFQSVLAAGIPLTVAGGFGVWIGLALAKKGSAT